MYANSRKKPKIENELERYLTNEAIEKDMPMLSFWKEHYFRFIENHES